MFLKRVFDMAAAFAGIVILVPVFLVIALLIRIKMSKPVIFKQIRAGRYGKAFTIYKFRTMFMDHQGSTVSVLGDKRVTPLGAVLRKYKLDELPELFNVLKGDLSFVGPRPDMPEYAGKLSGEERRILELRPGITGPATIKYANEEKLLALVDDPVRYNDDVLWPDKVRLNLDYYYTRTFLGDLKILLRTIIHISA
jgi:lipopolysaccharide/colanic/teichoic acid biosynthesis glycosyltransferase